MRVNEKIERTTPDTLICGIDVGKTKCCARFCDYRGLEVYHKVCFDKTENLPPTFFGISNVTRLFVFAKLFNLLSYSVITKRLSLFISTIELRYLKIEIVSIVVPDLEIIIKD